MLNHVLFHMLDQMLNDQVLNLVHDVWYVFLLVL